MQTQDHPLREGYWYARRGTALWPVQGLGCRTESYKIRAQEQLRGHEQQEATYMAIESMHELPQGALIPTLQGHETCQPQPNPQIKI